MRAFLAVAVLAASCTARSHKSWERLKRRMLEGAVPTSDDVELMLDATMKWSDREAVLRLCERLARLDLAVAYLEEPLPSDDLAGYAWLTSRSPIPIAGGEHEFDVTA